MYLQPNASIVMVYPIGSCGALIIERFQICFYQCFLIFNFWIHDANKYQKEFGDFYNQLQKKTKNNNKQVIKVNIGQHGLADHSQLPIANFKFGYYQK